jgi:lipid A 3-O-deacylase
MVMQSWKEVLGTGVLALFISTIDAAESLEESMDKASSWSLNVYFENDLFSDTDQQYTNGTKISWVSRDVSNYVDTNFPVLTGFIDREVHFLHRNYDTKNLSFSIGQNMYTPQDIVTTELVEDDRPYAGWLYLSTGFHAKSNQVQDTLNIQLGMIGPSALGKEIQDWVHDWRDIPRANGWANQLDNELGLNIIGERRIRLEPDNTGVGWEADAVANGAVVLGNVNTELNLGIEGRVGYNLPQDFGTTHIRPGGETNIPGLSRVPGRPGYGSEQDFGVLLFASLQGRAVLRDIFLDGNTFSDSHSVDKEPLVADLAYGVKIKVKSVKLSLSLVHRTKQFKNQPESHAFGSIMASYSH